MQKIAHMEFDRVFRYEELLGELLVGASVNYHVIQVKKEGKW